MNELRELLATLQAASPDDEFVVVTVVAVAGSTYRRPGARMLVSRSGAHIGAISGGCLEDDVRKRAFWLTESGPAVVSYDTGADEDGGYGVGCRGIVTVLMERVRGGALRGYFASLDACEKVGRPAISATVIRADSGCGARIGNRAWLHDGACCSHDDGESNSRDSAEIGDQLREALIDAAANRRTRIITIGTSYGAIDIFVEVIPPPVHVVIFGGGYDITAVLRAAKCFGWRVSVVARRPQSLPRDRVADADAIITLDHAIETIPRDRTTALIVMTHNFVEDQRILAGIFQSDLVPAYLGVLGPRSRTEELLDALRATETPPTAPQLARLHAPIGLDIGADGPAQIALSIVAEIQAAISGRTGRPLRGLDGPLHDRADDGAAVVSDVSIRATCEPTCVTHETPATR